MMLCLNRERYLCPSSDSADTVKRIGVWEWKKIFKSLAKNLQAFSRVTYCFSSQIKFEYNKSEPKLFVM